MERTFVMIKPDAVSRGLSGSIINRFEQRNIKIVAMKMMILSESFAAIHYAEHVGKSFYDELISFITSGPVLAMVLESPNVISIARAMMGKTNSADAAPGTIRGDYSMSNQQNIIHGSDSFESAQREISHFFKNEEIVGC
ncbi:MAG: nucleoside-diphosphate kinase [Candidatus Margulisiibacteriota bacterium]|nr:MAG: nucleoside-diphosphate kinase [Candidatus Margulisbacteria bacterium GWD2_39_127]OGI04591.1 MAG: nucleoside-diphosphate kinase [Candidatus Margulisbacteria bacterium GWF2_38_17]OGI11877.1 MAG: nucleoside-diphosphate kinase [Candidatus Margulisbacteria bacterium GWE2_39_32]PZM83112.1 MAG: nucleoside-diphosphate kinase [Candidatus Margulisiibacteriota bacterium]HAR62220.1 nucleoside-diphosphate kinase [Candidatus Margulisiibacteriota bacterium]